MGWASPHPHEAWHQRVLRTAIIISLVGHAAVLAVQLVTLRWHGGTGPRKARLIYHREPIKSTSAWTKEETAPAQTRLKDLARTVPVGSGSAGMPAGNITVGIGRAHGALDSAEAGRAWGGISESGEALEGAMGSGRWASAVDLTNLTAAAQGNPLLYTYFGAIREQIQHTANSQDWMPNAAPISGIIYIGFVLEQAGHIQSAAVIPERSAGAPQLQAVALRIVQAAGPFPPFPPSFAEKTKAIVIPMEFSPVN